MKRGIIASAFLVAAFTSAEARWYDTMGMGAYKKLCRSCHGHSYKGAAMHTEKEWNRYFADNAKKLIESHAQVPETKDIFLSSYFKNRRDNLENFLSKNGSDSGVVPGCDGNFCR